MPADEEVRETGGRERVSERSHRVQPSISRGSNSIRSRKARVGESEGKIKTRQQQPMPDPAGLEEEGSRGERKRRRSNNKDAAVAASGQQFFLLHHE